MNAIKKQSPQAQVAKRIKQYCKSKGISCKAKSSSFSMGDSVTVTIEDQPPKVFKDIEAFANEHQYGDFNGMEDIYEYSNSRDDIPQSKYVHVDNDYSDELRQAAWDFIREAYNYADMADAPESINDLNCCQVGGVYADTFIYRFLNGSVPPVCSAEGDLDYSADFWKAREQTTAAAPVATSEGATIEEHTHTKGGFQMFIVILADRVDREVYLQLLEKAKDLGGWYSRKWGATPAGFAFKELAAAEGFLGDAPTPTDGGAPAPNTHLAGKLRTLADKMQGDIDNKLGDRLTNTPKRQREAGNARLDGERLQRAQEGLNRLADLHDAGTVPAALVGVKTKKAAFDLARSEIDHSGGYYDAGRCQGVPASDSAEALAFWELLKGKSEVEKKADQLREMEDKLMFSDIPGFFPTPNAVIDSMLEVAEIEEHHTLLEPSAGSGAIAGRLGLAVDCCETQNSLREILSFKGHKLVAHDFLTAEFPHKYDRIVMNPPFEKGQDIKHIRHAAGMLAPGGVLVAICAGGSRQKEQLEPLAELWEPLPIGTFKEVGTGVNTVLLTIRATGGAS